MTYPLRGLCHRQAGKGGRTLRGETETRRRRFRRRRHGLGTAANAKPILGGGRVDDGDGGSKPSREGERGRRGKIKPFDDGGGGETVGKALDGDGRGGPEEEWVDDVR